MLPLPITALNTTLSHPFPVLTHKAFCTERYLINREALGLSKTWNDDPN